MGTGIEWSLSYNGFTGTAEHDGEVFHGKITGIKDIVTYESDTDDGLKEEFCIAVDDYIETRALIDKRT